MKKMRFQSRSKGFAGGEDDSSLDYSEVAGAIPVADISCEK